MKKSLCLVLLVFLFSGFRLRRRREDSSSTSTANCMDLPANNFTGQDSQYKIFFEAKAAYMILGNLYVWASHGYFPLHDSWTGWSSKNSFAKDISVERTLAKRIVSGGCGFFAGYFRKEQFAVRARNRRLFHRQCHRHDDQRSEHQLSSYSAETARQAGIGLRGNLAFTYGLYKNVFGELSGGLHVRLRQDRRCAHQSGRLGTCNWAWG